MFRKQSRRLLRSVKSIKQLAQETWAVFNSDEPLELTQPLVIYQQPGGVPPITIIMQPTDGGGTQQSPIQTIYQGQPATPAIPGPPAIPGVPPHQNLPDWQVSTEGVPRPTPTIPNVPPPPNWYPPVPPSFPGLPEPPDPTDPPVPPLSLPPIDDPDPVDIPGDGTGGSGGSGGLDVVIGTKVSGQNYNITYTGGSGVGVAVGVNEDATVPEGTVCVGLLIAGTIKIYPPAFVEDPPDE
jgi:hypothetical protein